MLNLFWIFEHITSGPFYGLLSVNFAHAKSYPETFGHLYSDLLAINVYQGANFALWSSFQVKFERVVNGLGGQKSSQMSISTWSNGFQCKNRKIVTYGVTGAKMVYFFGLKT